jgi:hypothetical protein
MQTGNPKTLVFVDSSHYYTEPEKPLLEITLPGHNKFFLVNVVARKVNTFNSNTIGLTQTFQNVQLTDLPDGAYHLRYKVCPYDYYAEEKTIFRTVLIEEKLAGVYDKLEASECSKKEDKKILEDIVHITVLIEGAKAVACKNKKKANEFYQLADKLIDRILGELCNTCN